MTITSWTRPVNAVLFDLDGTLLHTAPDITAAVNMMLKSRNLPVLPEALVTNLIGRGSPALIDRVFDVHDVPLSPGERLDALQLFQQFYEEIVGTCARPYPGVVDALERLRDMDLKLAVVTNKYHRFAIRLLRQFHMASLFDLVVGGDTLEARKPNPLPILHTCDSLGVPVTQALYIGDSPIDVEAAKAAGIPVFCVPYGYREGQALSALACDGFIESLADIPTMITGRHGARREQKSA
ncbi:phosphoglycolate phosphatase [Noviherbaspirillum sp.]|uniref:phosphoglycolate phosphatase n=1 Tax=Noviherbaspirillum sp. TaxID=1926288 RepID=UPI002B484E77|nr:phosphoglycolate phosphatase [Noviherbaspirillum sp.]HJV83751.1 phosphoglycolate phosphatase [Noviherbaspirillum sp.]